ncbi:MAG TPA: c-type cytochrome [Candidatus Binatia bacterium]|nr:c-type cytochrome [Candidatus Binatia bacterium]
MIRTRRLCSLIVGVILALALALSATSNGAWLAKVPATEHEKVNPYHEQQDAIAAGQRVFHEHCAHCHGEDAEGTKKRPSLRSPRVQQEASEGDLHWLLKNGSMGYGMPTWSKLGDPQIWQVVTYVKSLHLEVAH